MLEISMPLVSFMKNEALNNIAPSIRILLVPISNTPVSSESYGSASVPITGLLPPALVAVV